MSNVEQLALPLDYLPAVDRRIMIRSCPRDPAHTVFGTPASNGGDLWMCVECGIEWGFDRAKKYMVYHLIHEDGSSKEIGRVPLWRYPELKKYTRGVCL